LKVLKRIGGGGCKAGRRARPDKQPAAPLSASTSTHILGARATAGEFSRVH
jgi:hypothetical protein